MNIWIYMKIYMYIYRYEIKEIEREREREENVPDIKGAEIYIHIYLYICSHTEQKGTEAHWMIQHDLSTL